LQFFLQILVSKQHQYIMKKITTLSLLLIAFAFACTKKEMIEAPAADAGPALLPAAKPPAGVVSYLTGSAADVTPAPTPGLLLMGGGADVDAAIRWLLQRSGGGDIVVIRASGADGYNTYMYNMVPVNSVETLIIDSRAKAGLADVAQKIRNAEALFIAGGDQWNYVNYWKDTETENAINYLLNTKRAPVGGTSAGLAILGAAYFSAQNGSVLTSEALANPYNRYMTLGHNDFITAPFMQQTIMDSHYSQRDRQGRHITFLARMMKDWGYTKAKGIGVDEQTAVCVDGSGNAVVYGTNNAYFLQDNGAAAETCVSGSKLHWQRNQQAVRAYRIAGSNTGNGSFNLATWQTMSGGTAYFYYVNTGVLGS
jgi:cyanophycinase